MDSFNIENKFVFGGIIAIILIMLGVWQRFYFSGGIFDRPTTPTPTIIISPLKTIRSSSLPLKEMWRWSGNVVSGNVPNLAMNGNYLVLAAIDNEPPWNINIITFDISGKQLWEKTYPETKLPNDFNSLATDGIRVYIGSGRYLQAFDINNGNLLWTGAKERDGIPGTFNVYVDNGNVYGYSYYDYMVYRLEPQTGETEEVSHKPGIIIEMAGKDYGEYGFNRITSKDTSTNQLLWKQDLGAKVQVWPLFSDDMMFVSVGTDRGTDDREIVALSIDNGQILWRSGGYVSNIALSQNLLLAIKGNASLVALNPKTGEQVGEVTVQPAQTYQYKGTQHWGDYVVAASDRYIAAYYDDSQELIVFERTDRTH